MIRSCGKLTRNEILLNICTVLKKNFVADNVLSSNSAILGCCLGAPGPLFFWKYRSHWERRGREGQGASPQGLAATGSSRTQQSPVETSAACLCQPSRTSKGLAAPPKGSVRPGVNGSFVFSVFPCLLLLVIL